MQFIREFNCEKYDLIYTYYTEEIDIFGKTCSNKLEYGKRRVNSISINKKKRIFCLFN
jgi:hypothetical protein